jgi:hypothetical protein
MKTPILSRSRCCRPALAGRRIALFGCGLYLAVLGTTVVLSGCASTQPGLRREQALYSAGTNVIADIRSVTPYLPAPVGNTVEGVLALATAALAAWNTHLHAQMKTLRNGNGNGTKPSSPEGPSAPTPART